MKKIPELAGQPYRPSNGSEGRDFMHRYCNRCKRDALFRETGCSANSCPIVWNSMIYELGDPLYPKEWTRTAEGEPTCTSFEAEAP